MPLYMDRHDSIDNTPEEVAAAHEADLAIQEEFGVRYLSYWFEPMNRTVFCLADGPSREAVVEVHQRSHGLLASKVIEVDPSLLEALLGEIPEHPPGTSYTASAVRAVLFTDICGSTELSSRLGDDAAMEIVRKHNQIVKDAFEQHDGRVVKHTGDGAMGSFTSVAASVKAAILVHDMLNEWNESAAEPFQIRIGISAGEPIAEGDDLFGSVVNLASRLCTWVPSGGIAVSAAVRELCLGKKFSFIEHGPVALRGFSEEIPVYKVAW
jgi:class 3 adenylate cyclase